MERPVILSAPVPADYQQMIVADLEQILRGQPPLRCQRAQIENVSKFWNWKKTTS